MNLEREIFAAALDCETAEERAAYLRRACQGNEALRARIEELLRAEAASGAFLDGSTAAPLAGAGEAMIQEAPGSRIDRYRLVEKIGEGGFGVVYRAEQEVPVRRTVALKIIKLGMDTQAVVARFKAERQALALMDHPGIARVLDAGATANGRPYFVMELVEGVPITTYCAEHRLNLRARLHLFMQVCEAVEHAHQKGIIHRDLKPSNVLVTGEGESAQPKVIDFGIAKATQQRLIEQTVFSHLHPFIGTPAYMSPEQAGTQGIDVDTRSDIYSLGVLLYELLTDTTPFETRELLRAGYAEIQRTIREQEPPVPSRRLLTMDRQEQQTAAHRRRLEPAKLTSQLRGDLDRIVMKCLEKNRYRRYDTSSALAADLARHLNHQPVLARPDTVRYRAAKFVRRHARGLAVVGVGSIVLGASIVYHTVQLTGERDRVRLEAEKARSLSDLLAELLTASDPYRTRTAEEPTIRSLLEAGAERARLELSEQPELQAKMFAVIGRVHQRAGRHEAARPLLEEAVALTAPEGRDRLLHAEALNELGVLRAETGDVATAGSLLERALELRRSAGAAGSDIAVTLVELGRVFIDQGRGDRAEPLFREALALRRRELGSEHQETATSLSDLGLLLREKGELAEAERLLRECWEISRRTLGEEHPNVGTAVANLGLTVIDRDEPERAEIMFREALAIRRAALGENHPQVAQTLLNLGHALRRQQRFDEAEAAVLAAAKLVREGTSGDHPLLAFCSQALALIYLESDQPTRAVPVAREALTLRQRLVPAGDWRLAAIKSVLGTALHRSGERAEAEVLLREASATLRDVPGPQGREAAAHRARAASLD